MDSEKYNRSVNLLCPTCGGDQFASDGNPETPTSIKCASCEREFTKDELIELNSDNISEHVREMKGEITKDFANEMRGTLKRAFRGSKYIKIR